MGYGTDDDDDGDDDDDDDDDWGGGSLRAGSFVWGIACMPHSPH